MMQKQQRKYPTECMLCAEKLQEIPMQDTEMLRKFMSGQNKILPRRKTGACAKHQRTVALEIKRARDMCILRFRGQQAVGFITINEGFICNACGASVPPAKSTCRNHCNICLASMHVDERLPGDRASLCTALMTAIRTEGTDPDRLILTHKCTACGKIQRNKVAQDDNRDAIFSLMKRKSQALPLFKGELEGVNNDNQAPHLTSP